MNKIITILIMGMFLLVLLSTVSSYEITHRFYNETTVVTHYSDTLNKDFTWRIESEQLFDECKSGIGKSYINCSVNDYNAYIQSRVDLIEEGEIESFNVFNSFSENQNATFDTITASTYGYSSKGFDEPYTYQQYSNVLQNLKILPGGEINKTSYPDKLKIDDDTLNTGIIQNFIIFGLQKIDSFLQLLNIRVTDNEQKIEAMETETCIKDPSFSWC